MNKDQVRLQHMRNAACEAIEISHGKTRADLDRERLLNLALVRLLEIVGEAAARTSAEIRAANPTVPWAEVVSLRNRLIHGYDSIDFNILWAIVSHDLPPLVAALDDILAKPPSSRTEPGP